MTEKPSTWRHPWPPAYDVFPSDHINLIREWLSGSKGLKRLSSEVRSDLEGVVLTLDYTAWRLARELSVLSVSLDALRDTPFESVPSKDRNRYMRDISKVECIDNCEGVRDAIYCCDWGGAIGGALFVGRTEVGEFTQIGRSIAYQARSPDRRANRKSVPLNRQRLVEIEGAKLRAQHPEWNRQKVAGEIHAAHKGKIGFESENMIYRDLRSVFSKSPVQK